MPKLPRSRPVTCCFLALPLCILSSMTVQAQTFQAQVTGTVTDSSGAVVAGAHITATNVATAATYSTKTNDTGVYRLPYLSPAVYRVDCSLTGFKSYEQGPITLQVNQVLQLDVTLEPGPVSERITVAAGAAALETQSATLSQVVTTRSFENLPLNIRNPFGLVALTAGVVLGPNIGLGGGYGDVGRAYFATDYYVGGSRSGSQEILVDGAPSTLGDGAKAAIEPPTDSVQEFAVQSSNYSAQFGRSSGSVVNVVTKSGTNEIHGLLYDFERHSFLDANNFFNNRSNIKMNSWKRHQFGANLSGPILKKKWFFFGDYEGWRQGYPGTTISTVPTPPQRKGDFSQTFAANGALIRIFDPNTLAVLQDGTRQRSQFPGNVIPGSRIDAVSAATVQYYPEPNLSGNPVTNAQNHIYASNSTITSNKYDLRSDVNFTDNTRMFVRFSRQEDDRHAPGGMPPPAGGGRTVIDHYTQGVINLTRVLSATTVADVQFSASRALADQRGDSWGFDLSRLNLPAAYIAKILPMFPAFVMPDIASIPTDDILQHQPRNIFVTSGSITLIRGRHSLKFGGDWRILDFNEGQNMVGTGHFSFGRTFTQGPNPVQASATGGFGFGEFLLGTPFAGTAQQTQSISTRGLYYAVFAQDDWKITDRLTLNLGLRWEVAMGNREKYNRIAYFDPTLPSPLAGPAGLPNLTGILTWTGQGNPKDSQETDWSNFGPRFGLAYRLGSKAVLRGGYGITYLPRSIYANGLGAVSTLRRTDMVASLDGITPHDTLSNPFPDGLLPSVNDRDRLTTLGAAFTAPLHPFRSGYVQTWSLGFQRELPQGVILNVYYWGNKGTRLLTGFSAVLTLPQVNINQLPNQYLALGPRLNDMVANPFYGLISTGALAGPRISRSQTLLPFPQYLSINQCYGPWGDSSYHGATIQAERRMSSTLTFLVSYTRSKALDNARAPLNTYDFRSEKGLSSFSAPNLFKLSLVYSIPYGRGRAHGAGLDRVVDAIAGNWDVAGFGSFQSGAPVSVSRPSLNNGQSAQISQPTISKWFNTSVFSVAPAYTFGNVGPVLPDVQTDWMRNVDAVLMKNVPFSIRDRAIRAQFRFEVFNVSNTPRFGAPNGNITAASFGQVTSQANAPRDIQMGLKFVF